MYYLAARSGSPRLRAARDAIRSAAKHHARLVLGPLATIPFSPSPTHASASHRRSPPA